MAYLHNDLYICMFPLLLYLPLDSVVHENSLYLTVIIVMVTVSDFNKCHQFRPPELHTPNGRLRSYNRAIHKNADEANTWFGNSFGSFVVMKQLTVFYWVEQCKTILPAVCVQIVRSPSTARSEIAP